MEAAIKNLKPEEAMVLGVAPSSLQSAYKTLFKDINALYADLAKANYNFEKLTKAQIAAFRSDVKGHGPRVGQDQRLQQERLRRQGLDDADDDSITDAS